MNKSTIAQPAGRCAILKRWRERCFLAALEKVHAERTAYRARMRTPLANLPGPVRELVEIGEWLHHIGGMSAMLAAHQQISYWVPAKARSLEMAWDGIGDWRG